MNLSGKSLEIFIEDKASPDRTRRKVTASRNQDRVEIGITGESAEGLPDSAGYAPQYSVKVSYNPSLPGVRIEYTKPSFLPLLGRYAYEVRGRRSRPVVRQRNPYPVLCDKGNASYGRYLWVVQALSDVREPLARGLADAPQLGDIGYDCLLDYLDRSRDRGALAANKGPNGHLYNSPVYYEIAFSFRDFRREVGIFEDLMRMYAKTSGKHMLEICSGNSPHLEEILKRGFSYTGLDLSQHMLDYVEENAGCLDGDVELVRGNMNDFHISEPADFAYVTLGSFRAKNTEELDSHFDSMAQAVRPGGLYLMEWCLQFNPVPRAKERWVMSRDGIYVLTKFKSRTDIERGTVREELEVLSHDNLRPVHLRETSEFMMLTPPGFISYLSRRNDFELVGMWDNWDLSRPLTGYEKEVNRPIVVLRRTGYDPGYTRQQA